MNISTACEYVSKLAKKQGTGVLEVLIDYKDGIDESGFNHNLTIDENLACRVFMAAGYEMFAEVV
jgi:hypothetical protein